MAIFLMFLLGACSSSRQPSEPVPTVEETESLLRYLEENGNLLNSPHLPALINAEDLHRSLHARNIHVIDLRPLAQFQAGHIEHSTNVRPAKIMDHFEQVIDPASFDFIVLVCNDAMTSGVVNAVLLMLGYDNVMSLRYGLSSWDQGIAEQHWLAARSSHLTEQLERQTNPKAPAGQLPALGTGESTPYRILRARARELLAGALTTWQVSADQVHNSPDDYYHLSYWPESLYLDGHIRGAIQYTPKSSLQSHTYIRTLPTDRPVVTSCYTGQHSSYVTGFLRLLGYQAYNLPYGANSYIHDTMRETQGFFRYFTEEHVHGFPLMGSEHSGTRERMAPDQPQQEQAVIGGC